ncbi:hypothetical protein DMC30DRAFT_117200 [Rhodotorula diobovata]|uniref:BHLH domain-containing protein n=1 Tax=Rhodotorula diobovata TaxID=5288 RepID=A0A5C5G0Z5_9BASI|nr:hypothetical protein DMC30DRAFT_117200 [Rhodotorula diobovata]
MGAAQDLPFGFSPQSNEFEDQFDPLKFEDDEYALGDDDFDEHGFFGDDHDGSVEPSSLSGLGGGVGDGDAQQLVKKKRTNNRKGPQNADKRATHNAVERKRRESLNTRFIDLAKALPTTKHIKRPSKAVIVSKALDYVYDASAREHALTKENNELRCEVDQLRIRLGMPPLPPPVGLPEHRAATQPTLRKNRKASEVTVAAADKDAVAAGPSSSASSSPSSVPAVVDQAPVFPPAQPQQLHTPALLAVPLSPSGSSPASYMTSPGSTTSSASGSIATSASFDFATTTTTTAPSASSVTAASEPQQLLTPLTPAAPHLMHLSPGGAGAGAASPGAPPSGMGQISPEVMQALFASQAAAYGSAAAGLDPVAYLGGHHHAQHQQQQAPGGGLFCSPTVPPFHHPLAQASLSSFVAHPPSFYGQAQGVPQFGFLY